MTISKERTWAIQRTREFLRDLGNPKVTPKVPKEIRRRALRLLKHFPWDLHLEESAKALPEIWGDPERKE